MDSWDHYIPEANFSDWIQYYKNDVFFDPLTTGNHSVLFSFGFIYPISWIEDNTTISYFEQYASVTESYFAISLLDFKLTTKLSRDHFEVKYDFTCKRCLGKTLNYRIYNIHTGILSKFQYMYNNEGNTHFEIIQTGNIQNFTHFEIIISNPEDKVDSYSLLIPLVTILAIVIIRIVRRKPNK